MTGGAADSIVHAPVRLEIMGALDAEPHRGVIDFSRLKRITGATDGNLGAHLATLERAGYVALDKVPDGSRTRTIVAITPVGRAAFLGHVAYLQSIVDRAARKDR